MGGRGLGAWGGNRSRVGDSVRQSGVGVCLLALIAVSRAELDQITAVLKDGGLQALSAGVSWQQEGGSRGLGEPPLENGAPQLARQEGGAVARPHLAGLCRIPVNSVGQEGGRRKEGGKGGRGNPAS